MYAEAEMNLASWFQLLKQGKHAEAHQLSLPVGMRARRQTKLDEYYTNELRARQEMQAFFSEAPLTTIIALEQDWTVSLIENYDIEITNDEMLSLNQRFLIEYEQDGRHMTLPVRIKSSRIFDKYTQVSHWTVLTVQLDK